MSTFNDSMVANMSLAELDRYVDYLTPEQIKSRFTAIAIDVERELAEADDAVSRFDDLQSEVSDLEYELEEAQNRLEDADENCSIKDDLISTVQSLFSLLDVTDENEDGTPFHPVNISSCRSHLVPELERILKDLKDLADS
jgi:DNA repair ATPase RecN